MTMSIACSSLLSPILLPLASTSSISIKPGKCHNLAFTSACFHSYQSNGKREQKILVPEVASIPYPEPAPEPAPIPVPLDADVDYLEEEFSGHGVTFEGIGQNCVAKMTLENQSTAILMLPTGLIASYKPRMWHGGTDEILHCFASEDGVNGGGPAVQGGVSLAFSFANEGSKDELSWSPTNWTIQDIRGNSKDSIQVCF